MIWQVFLDCCLDAFLDCLKMAPFLFAAFLLLEWIEDHSQSFLNKVLQNRWLGPLAGSIFGCVPQCGFSSLASSLYSGGVIPVGTLLAVYLSTSDEAILIMLSDPTAIKSVGLLLLSKVMIGIIAGYIINMAIFMLPGKQKHVEDLCEKCHCHDSGSSSIFRSAWNHTYTLFRFILVCAVILNMAMELVGTNALQTLFLEGHIYQVFLTALVGLIPNCAVSILLTQLYMQGILSFGSTIAGLCSGAGVGLILLFRLNKNKKENLIIMAMLYVIAVVAGGILSVMIG